MTQDSQQPYEGDDRDDRNEDHSLVHDVQAGQFEHGFDRMKDKVNRDDGGDYDGGGARRPRRQQMSFEVVRPDRILERNHGPFLLIPTQCLPHVVSVLFAILTRRVVVENRAVDLRVRGR